MAHLQSWWSASRGSIGLLSIHALRAFLRSEVSLTLVTPKLWPAPDSQDSAYRLVARVTHMSLGKWPALSGGSAITLDIRLPHSSGSAWAGWVEALIAWTAVLMQPTCLDAGERLCSARRDMGLLIEAGPLLCVGHKVP